MSGSSRYNTTVSLFYNFYFQWIVFTFLLYHICMILIFTCIWLTESICKSSIDSMLLLSLPLKFSNIPRRLFWHFCNLLISQFLVSSTFLLISLYNWSLLRSLLVEILSATFLSCVLSMWFFSLLMRNSRGSGQSLPLLFHCFKFSIFGSLQ